MVVTQEYLLEYVRALDLRLESMTDEELLRKIQYGINNLSDTMLCFFTQETFKINDYDLPPDAKLLGYGIDWGYSDPSSLVSVHKVGEDIYCKELLYLRNITIPDFIYKIKDLGLNLTDDFICDSANPQAIEELRRNGINAKPVKKNSILHGIDLIKRNNFYVYYESQNLNNELQSYIWKQDKNGNNLDEPVDDSNHLIDGIRYVLEMKLNRNTWVGVY